MRAKLKAGLRQVFLAAMALATVPAGAQAQAAPVSFQWPENPFAPTLPGQLFLPTEEYRFEKAQRVFGESMSGIGDELFQIATYPLRDPLTFGAFALGVGALTLVDRQTTALYQQTIVPIGEAFDLPRPFNIQHLTTDGQYIAGAVLGTYAYGLAANDERSQVAALLATKAIFYSYFTSHVILKAAFGRVRPVNDLATHTGPTGNFSTSPFDFFQSTGLHFDSFAYATGMPSFHFTMYFATARVYSGVYDNYLIPYAAAAALALQSAEGHNHWVSDMVAGALIGTGIGNVVLNSYEDRRRQSFGTVVPLIGDGSMGLGFQMSF